LILRRSVGEPAESLRYFIVLSERRHGRIDPERWRVLEPLLDRALELTVEERASWLEELRRNRRRSPKTSLLSSPKETGIYYYRFEAAGDRATGSVLVVK
jgi:hypothetical protein